MIIQSAFNTALHLKRAATWRVCMLRRGCPYPHAFQQKLLVRSIVERTLQAGNGGLKAVYWQVLMIIQFAFNTTLHLKRAATWRVCMLRRGCPYPHAFQQKLLVRSIVERTLQAGNGGLKAVYWQVLMIIQFAFNTTLHLKRAATWRVCMLRRGCPYPHAFQALGFQNGRLFPGCRWDFVPGMNWDDKIAPTSHAFNATLQSIMICWVAGM